MCLEFDSQCCTSQVEDSLQLHLPTTLPKSHANVSLADYWPLLKKFGGTDNWPSHSMILPGKSFDENLVVSFLSLFSNYSLVQAMK